MGLKSLIEKLEDCEWELNPTILQQYIMCLLNSNRISFSCHETVHIYVRNLVLLGGFGSLSLLQTNLSPKLSLCCQ